MCQADDRGPDEESAAWLRRLGAAGAERRAAERELHARLVRIALAEVRRRAAGTPVAGRELDDVAHQAADDAMLAILAKLADFRGESRFITWAYRFVILASDDAAHMTGGYMVADGGYNMVGA